MRKFKASELVIDFTVYPRADIDRQHVGYIAQAMAAGAEMPPLVVEKKSKRVIDGAHRLRAAQKLYGNDAEVEVVEKSYRTEAELFLDAVRYNASHGRNLTSYDRAHCAILGANLGIDDASLADCLHVDAKYVGDLRVDRSAFAGALHVPLKRTIGHKAGQKLTKQQQAANERLSGMSQLFYVNQVITLIESDLLDTANEGLMEALQRLAGLIEGLKATV